MKDRSEIRRKPQKQYKAGLVVIFGALGLTVVSLLFMGNRLSSTLAQASESVRLAIAVMRTTPGALPDGLPAASYYVLGVTNKGKGWVEASRSALLKAVEADTDKTGKIGTYGYNARIFLRTCLPKKPISPEAEQSNISAFNQMNNAAKASSAFKKMIATYPGFEWPLGNLASMYIEENRIDEAEELIDKALEINPDYLNGLTYKAELKVKQGQYDEARAALLRALELLGPPDKLEHVMRERYDEILAMQERIKLQGRRQAASI